MVVGGMAGRIMGLWHRAQVEYMTVSTRDWLRNSSTGECLRMKAAQVYRRRRMSRSR